MKAKSDNILGEYAFSWHLTIYEWFLQLYFNSTGYNTWFIGILTFIFSCKTQFYNSTRNHTYMFGVPWFYSTGHSTWFIGILTFDVISYQTQFYNSTRNHTYMFGVPWFYSTAFSTRIVGILAFEQLMQYPILQFYKKSHIYDLLLKL